MITADFRLTGLRFAFQSINVFLPAEKKADKKLDIPDETESLVFFQCNSVS